MEDVTSAENATLSHWEILMDFSLLSPKFSFSQRIFQSSLIIIGLLLNGVVFLVVSLSRQLHYPRHIFWAAIAFFECIFLVQCQLELMVVVNHDRLACQPYVVLASVDYSVLLIYHSMATLDRYLAIARYEWYKESVTNCGVLVLIALASFLTFVITTIPFWTGYLSVYTCSLHLAHLHWVLAWDLFLGIVCVILHLKIFVKSKSLIQHYMPNYRQESVTVKFVNHSSNRQSSANYGRGEETSAAAGAERVVITFPENPPVTFNENAIRPCFGDAQMTSYIDQLDAECFPWMPMRSKVNRLEVRAALNMSVNILPFWLCTFPVSCNVMTLYWCVRLESDCAYTAINIHGHLWNLFMLHSIYNPIMYMSTSSEFRRAVIHILRKMMKVLRIGIQTNAN
ncbi:uncharacterized protein LOC124205458 [Daphnia pulex]|uniref:uncharacterized protein LOC124205458 n=1 Tax=Daphnia pulex TaxID=6669 RepID=UPI001EE0FE27|nr:uncharacterized protein LOC124205458 [Daphnia pulex]